MFRTYAHSPEGGWSAIAIHLAPAETTGFYLTLFPDARPPVVVFLNGVQLTALLEMAETATVTDQALWDVVAKIPMEPLLPCRSLYPRLRALLIDSAAPIRDQLQQQAERPAPAPAVEPEEAPASDPSEAPAAESASLPSDRIPSAEPAES